MTLCAKTVIQLDDKMVLAPVANCFQLHTALLNNVLSNYMFATSIHSNK